jgi:transposase
MLNLDQGTSVMLTLHEKIQVYLARDPVDRRKQIDGLILIVQEVFDLDPFAPALLAFCNRQRDKIKQDVILAQKWILPPV